MGSDNTSNLTSSKPQARDVLAVALRIASLGDQNKLGTWDLDADETSAHIFRQTLLLGGVGAVDDFIDLVNACLDSAGASHRLSPGCVCMQTGDCPEVLTIATCAAGTEEAEYSHQIRF